ncbi:MAG: hypothetical protein HN431_05480, partial [Bacteroidetes bacterium]|nr:hypothetical protein [Bacteroidota bacterium]
MSEICKSVFRKGELATLVLDNYIANLLYDHNCVIVPSFGA